MIITICSAIITVASVFTLLISWRREIKKIHEGQKCLLRDGIVKAYYKHNDNEQIPQYEKESAIKLYEAYKALGGNSFVEDLMEEIRSWEVVR